MKKHFLLFCIALAAFSVQAQECEPLYRRAVELYGQNNYREALNQCRVIESFNTCMDRIGDQVRNLKGRCEAGLEAEDYQNFRNTRTVAACDRYLNAHPQGRHAQEVREWRTELRRTSDLSSTANEETLYRECERSLSACEEYLRRYPHGRYREAVQRKKRQHEQARSEREENDAFRSIKTLYDCEQYLLNYPNGNHRSRVVSRRNELQARAREAERTAYMDILQIEYANTDAQRNTIDDYGFTMYSSDIRFLMPRIVYDGIGVENKYVTLDCKIINPDGTLQSASSSPRGYTYSKSFWVLTGVENTCVLPAWGNAQGGVFVPGEYEFEIWYEGRMIYNTTFSVLDRNNGSGRGNANERSSLLASGYWRNTLRNCHADGATEYSDGVYKGQLSHGVRGGMGMYAWNNGYYYIGKWRDGNPNGWGFFMVPQYDDEILNCPDCAYYVGEWVDGRKSGGGTCYDRFGNALYHGTFSNDRPTQDYPMTGFDAYKLLCIRYGDDHYYVGETVNGTPHGKGMLFWSNGDFWYGSFVNGEPNGNGLNMSANGLISIGPWRGR